MKKSKKLLIGAAISALVVAAVSVALTYSYLVDVDGRNNVITIGNISLNIDEGSYRDTDIVSQSIVPKSPKVINNGTNDEYVFLRVRVPKESVTLLYETDTTVGGQTHKKGEIIDRANSPALKEIFKIQTDSSPSSPASSQITVSGHDDIVFSYHHGTRNVTTQTEGWYLLTDKNQFDKEISGKKYDEFYFGYNKRLTPSSETKTLFDKIQLKSFIDEEVNRQVELDVFAYGIQADKLDLSLPEDGSILTVDQVKSVFAVVERKQVM